ncbi:MAG TPA: methionyl-tRNA formyltransferase [bacterium]|nr:methionyl-tRNA formyltransferase [bacterium]HXC65375.1 methionyl-tRNA formyltransferase [bacterium]
MSLRLGFLGTGDFAVPALRALHGAGHSLALVICQPDRPKGRGHQWQAPPLKQAAQALGLAVEQPERMRSPEALALMQAARLDLACVVSYGQILPQAVLDAPRLGCVNVHASLLPRWRGAAPIEWALAAGDHETGVCVQRMVYKLDAGDVLLEARRDLGPQDDAEALHAQLAQLGAGLLLRAVDGLAAGTLGGAPQDEALATLAPLLKKSDGALDPAWDRRHSLNRFRAFRARPGFWLQLDGGDLLKLHGLSDAGAEPGEPGRVLAIEAKGLKLSCGDGALWAEQVQPPSGKVMPAAAYARGHAVKPGDRWRRPDLG